MLDHQLIAFTKYTRFDQVAVIIFAGVNFFIISQNDVKNCLSNFW